MAIEPIRRAVIEFMNEINEQETSNTWIKGISSFINVWLYDRCVPFHTNDLY